MTIRQILQVPDARLEMRCEPVSVLDKRVLGICGDLLDTMRKYPKTCLGLSAPQIGETLRIFAMSMRMGVPFSVLINPVVLSREGVQETAEEGCMSVRMGAQPFVRVRRHSVVVVRFLTRENKPCVARIAGMAARVIQHEIDHLDGVLITSLRAAA